MLTRFTVVIILQYIQILNRYVVHLKHMLYVNYPQFKKRFPEGPSRNIFMDIPARLCTQHTHNTCPLDCIIPKTATLYTKVLLCKQQRKNSPANQLWSQRFLYLGIFTLYVLKTLIQASSDVDLIIWLSFPYTKRKMQGR